MREYEATIGRKASSVTFVLLQIFRLKPVTTGEAVLALTALLPIFDNLSGLMDRMGLPTISLPIRLLILGCCIWMTAISNLGRFALLQLFLIIIFLPLFSTPLLHSFGYKFVADAGNSIKVLFPIGLAAGLISFHQQGLVNPRMMRDTVFVAALLYATVIVLTGVTGIGFATYKSGLGTKGFMTAGNDVGILLVASSFVIVERLREVKGRREAIRYWICVLIFVASLVLLFTRTAQLGIVLTVVLFVLASRTGRFAILGITIFAVAVDLMRPDSFLIKVYGVLNFLYLIGGWQGLIFHGREATINNLGVIWDSMHPVEQWLGTGQTRWETINGLYWHGDPKPAELDWVDLTFENGIIGAVSTAGCYLYYLFVAIWRRSSVVWPLLLLMAHATLAGHVVMSAIVGTVAALYFAIGATEK